MSTAKDTREARAAYDRGAWREAHDLLARADARGSLEPDDLWRHAIAASLSGHDDEFFPLMERAHDAHVARNEHRAAARCAFWLGFRLGTRGETGAASGWLARATRLVEHCGDDCVERGYLHLPDGVRRLASGDAEGAWQAGASAAAAAERFADNDLLALAIHLQGRARLVEGRVDEGLALLDEAMIGVASGRLSPHVTGLVYCSVIGACRSIYELGRAREWTHALRDWCRRQPGLLVFSGECVAYRAELANLRGEWRQAIDEAMTVCRDPDAGYDKSAVAAAFLQCGDAHRLLGDHEAAERAYHEAARRGREPQPGLALLRAEQGDPRAAAAALQRSLAERRDPLQRARLLPALVDVLVELGDTGEAAAACDELERIAARFRTETLATIAAGARGAQLLAAGDVADALRHLRDALRGWELLDAPYEAARVRVLLAAACDALGDRDGAALEIDNARRAFRQLGAAAAHARLDAARARPGAPHGLTPRESEVLALIARGDSNRSVATTLGISEKTVARHLSNIYGKLGLSSRAAAAAYAWEHGLLSPPA